MNKFILIGITALVWSFACNAQTINELLNEPKPIHDKDISQLSPIEIQEDSLVHIADSMYTSPSEEQKMDANIAFIKKIKLALKLPNSYNHAFPKLSNKISILQSPDQMFKLYTWELIPNESNIRYYGVIQMMDGKYFPIIDVSSEIIRGAEDSVLTNMKWFGALYYNIVQKQVNGVPIYFLIGFNEANLNSDRKIIDVFTFNKNNQPTFGAPFFNSIDRSKRKEVNRYIIEYQKGARVSLNEDKENGMIIVDHCESQIGDPAKKYTYLPDGTYDGFIWDNNKWNLSENVIQVVEQATPPGGEQIK